MKIKKYIYKFIENVLSQFKPNTDDIINGCYSYTSSVFAIPDWCVDCYTFNNSHSVYQK